ANAAAPIHALIDQMTKPKPISQAAKVLPPDIQQAIETQAQQAIKQEEATALLETNTSNTSQITQGESIFQNIADTIQEVTTTNPADRAKIKLKSIDRLIAKLQNL